MSRIDFDFNPLHRIVREHDRRVSNSLVRLSTGLRINRAADDPSGLIASEKLRADSRAISAAIQNTERAGLVLNIAEGGLAEISNLLIEAQGLIVATANDAGLSSEQKRANQLQLESILEAVDLIAGSTSFQGKKLLDGSYDGVSFALGPDPEDGKAQLSIPEVSAEALGLDPLRSATTTDVIDADHNTRERLVTAANRIADLTGESDGSAFSLFVTATDLIEQHGGDLDAAKSAAAQAGSGPDSGFLGLASKLVELVEGDTADAQEAIDLVAGFIDLTGHDPDEGKIIFAQAIKLGHADLIDGDLGLAQTIIDRALEGVNGLRARVGAFQKDTVATTLASLRVALENILAAESAIRDTDFAQELAELTRHQILASAGREAIKISDANTANILKLI